MSDKVTKNLLNFAKGIQDAGGFGAVSALVQERNAQFKFGVVTTTKGKTLHRSTCTNGGGYWFAEDMLFNTREEALTSHPDARGCMRCYAMYDEAEKK